MVDAIDLQEHFVKATGPQVIMPKSIQKYLDLTQAQMIKATGFSTLIAADKKTRLGLAKIALSSSKEQKKMEHMDAFNKAAAAEKLTKNFLEYYGAAEFIGDSPHSQAVIFLKDIPTKKAADAYYESRYKSGLFYPDIKRPVDMTGISPREQARLLFYHEASHIALGHSEYRLKGKGQVEELRKETEADKRAIQLYLEDCPPEEKEMRVNNVQAWEDRRALTTMWRSYFNFGHDTNIFFDASSSGVASKFTGQESHTPDALSYVFALTAQNAAVFVTPELLDQFHLGLNAEGKAMVNGVAATVEKRDLLKNSFPEIQYAMAKALLNRGAFDKDPMAKDMVQEYVEAIDRRVPAIGKNENVLAMSVELERTMPDSALTLNKGGQAVAKTAKTSMLSMDP